MVSANTSGPIGYKFEIKRQHYAAYQQVASGFNAWFAYTARIAGHFQMRVTAIIDGQPTVSTPMQLEVQFPSFGTINARTADETSLIWRNELAWTAKTHLCREEGEWIQLDTHTGDYWLTGRVYGAELSGRACSTSEGASVQLGNRAPDTISSPPDFNGGAVYTVASFHTHTPLRYDPELLIKVGPSPDDTAADRRDDVTGLVYDYRPDPPNGENVPAFYGLYKPAKIYWSKGPLERSTPP